LSRTFSHLLTIFEKFLHLLAYRGSSRGAEVQRRRGGAEVQRCRGACAVVEVLRCSAGAEVQRCRGEKMQVR
jgi:hypothetical protein